ncbi:hypothetical protein C8J56DRAFT_148827 [Mycena floridula]|nr:hypothetical protein C8J56DRAFT_148827 [Mycena floridula]
MVARWKVLMDGLLLFAALFSAVVTAFIIESYKTLSPDPSAMTVVLLYHISQQLSTITNTTELQISLPDLNGLPTLAVITNIFWFLSLALSLTCALTATLIEQWASDYVRAIERREAPAIKARIRAYLFEGVEKSNVAAIVEGTPLLLHASLFSFFIGLIFFLHPISTIMTFLSAGILAAFGVAYLSATIAPLIDTASPIRTPLTTLVLQFSFARNLLRKISLCGIQVASIVRSQVGAGALACWRPVKKFSSVVAEVGRASRERLSNWARHIRLSFSRKTEPDITVMQPSSEMEVMSEYGFPSWLQPNLTLMQPTEQSATPLLKWQWLKPFVEIWSENTLYTSNLDTLKESTALNDSLPEFPKREIDSLSWTLQHTTNDGEMLPFLEGIPVYLNSRWSDLHFGKPPTPFDKSPAQVLRTVLQNPESTFLSKLETFISTRWRSMSQRDASAVVNALSSLFENKVNRYTEATAFLPSPYSSDLLQDFMEHAIQLHPSLSPAIRCLAVRAVLRCAQARGSKYTTTYDDLRYCWPYNSIRVPVASFRYSELRPFWDVITSFLGFGWKHGDVLTSPTAATAATAAEANQGIALLSLCMFFWEAVPDPQGHFTDTFHYVMWDLISYVPPLAKGSASAQQAYSAAVLLIALAVEEASPELKRGRWYGRTVDAISTLLYPLVRIADDAAAATAQRVLCSPVWSDSTAALGNIPFSWPENPKVNQTIYAGQLKRYLNPWWHASESWPLIPANVTTLAGLPSTIQIEITESLKGWRPNGRPDDLQHLPSLFRLLGTLDEPKAVIEGQRLLREFLITPQTENDLDAAREALRDLEKTAKNPRFVLQALASVPDYP